MQSFLPKGNTVNIVVGAATANVALGPRQSVGLQCRVMNNGTATVWINFGDSAVTASLSTSVPVGPGVTEVFTLPLDVTTNVFAAAIAAGVTGTIYFTFGRGV